MAKTRSRLIIFLAVLLLFPSMAQAQRAVQILEEEINLLKEAIESNNRQIRKLKERLEESEKGTKTYQRAIQDVRTRLKRINVLTRELQELEAKISEGVSGKKDASKLGLHAEVRVRPEYTSNRTDLSSDSKDDDGTWGHRIRIGADFGMEQWVKARIVVQEVRSFGATNNQGNGGKIGAHEAWLELAPPKLKGLSLRAGRMELSYGNERLIGRNDFSLVGQAFDGVLTRWSSPKTFNADLFYTKIRESGSQDGDKDFWGLYTTLHTIPNTELDVYAFYLMDNLEKSVDVSGTPTVRSFKSQIWSVGARSEVLLFKSLFIEAEAVFQFGDRTDPVQGETELSHFAAAYYGELSYQVDIPSHPKIGAFFVQASGDENATDSKSIEFLPLFPTRHSFLGTMDLFSWTNIRDFGGKFEMSPGDFGIFAAFHYIQLATNRGSRLPGFGTGKTPDPTKVIGRNVGWEIDAALSWAPNPQLQLQAGYSYFSPGTVTEELEICGKDSGRDCSAAQWAYLQTRVKF